MQAKILVIHGDGIGPEVTTVGQAVLKKVAELFGHQFSFEEALLGHQAIVATGQPLPEDTLQKAKNVDAILFGAIGHPMYDQNPNLSVRPEQGLLKLRKELGLFANLRPIQVFDELLEASPIKSEILRGADILFFRELTGGIYFGTPRERRDNGNTAVDTCIYTKAEVRRIAVMAFQAAKNRRGKVTSVDKANVLETSRLWRETVTEVAQEFPEVELEHQLVDSMTMKLISQPRNYDVILTENLFGDILTDEASQIAGSMGLLASASVGSNVGLYEPIHGSAPDIAGQNVANPIASVLSASLLLSMSLNLKTESEAVVQAVRLVLSEGYRTKDIATPTTPSDKLLGTREMGEKILQKLATLAV